MSRAEVEGLHLGAVVDEAGEARQSNLHVVLRDFLSQGSKVPLNTFRRSQVWLLENGSGEGREVVT